MAKKITIKVEASSKDPYSRYHAVTIDEDLPPNFWTTPIPKKTAGGHFVWTKDVDLGPGRHYVVYGNSADCGEQYRWSGAIYVNDKKIADSTTICRGNYLEAYFTVPQLTVLNRIVSRVSKASILGGFKLLAGGKIIKWIKKANEGKK